MFLSISNSVQFFLNLVLFFLYAFWDWGKILELVLKIYFILI